MAGTVDGSHYLQSWGHWLRALTRSDHRDMKRWPILVAAGLVSLTTIWLMALNLPVFGQHVYRSSGLEVQVEIPFHLVPLNFPVWFDGPVPSFGFDYDCHVLVNIRTDAKGEPLPGGPQAIAGPSILWRSGLIPGYYTVEETHTAPVLLDFYDGWETVAVSTSSYGPVILKRSE